MIRKRPPLKHTESVTTSNEKPLPEYRKRRSSVKIAAINALSSHFEHAELNFEDKDEVCSSTLDNELDKQTHPEHRVEITGLHLAARKGIMDDIEGLLSEGIDVDIEDQAGRSPLYHACEKGQIGAALMLIKHGANVNWTKVGHATLLQAAVSSGIPELLTPLIDAGASLDLRNTLTKRTALHMAAISTDSRVLEVLLSHITPDVWECKRLTEMKDEKGRTALHLSALTSNNETVKLLLSVGADMTCKDEDGLSPLHLALVSHRKKLKCTRVLSAFLEAGGDIEAKGPNQETLVHFASRIGCRFCLELLCKAGASLDVQDKNGCTPLHLAALERHLDVITYLVRQEVDVNILSSDTKSALHMAILGDCSRCVAALVEAGCSTTVLDKNGITPIQIAFINKKIEAFQCLVRLKVVSLPEGAGEDLIHYCSSLGSINSVDFLLEQGWNINLQDQKLRSPLHVSLLHGNERLAVVLINKGCSLSLVDYSGATPLHYAVRWCGSDAVLRMILKKKVSLETRDRLGRTPLHYAASKFSVMSDLYILLEAHPQLNAQDDMGLTALHLAARFGNESLVRILLDKGAKHDLQDVDGFQPIDHAKEKNLKSITARLIKHDSQVQSSPKDNEEISSNIVAHRKSVSW